MLLSLHIENIALISQADIDLSPGFTSMTGETGAGKSILVDSIYFLSGSKSTSGAKAASELIRTGESECLVSGTFSGIPEDVITKLSENGIEYDIDDDCLILTRRMTLDGKGTCRINGKAVPMSLFRQIASELVMIHGQNDSLAILDRSKHEVYLDSSPRGELAEKISEAKNNYQALYTELKKTEREIKQLESAEKEKNRRMISLKFEINDITSAKIKDGEEDSLLKKKAELRNSEKISSSLKTAVKALDGLSKQRGAVELLAIASTKAATASEYIQELSTFAEKLESLRYEAEDVLKEIKSYADEYEDDPTEALNKTEARLDAIYRMKLKYGSTEKEILEYLSKIKKEYASLNDSENEKAKLIEKRNDLYKESLLASSVLTELRKEAKSLLEERMTERMRYLDMKKTEFSVSMIPAENGELLPGGAESIEFLIKSNAGEPFKPLSAIASGGELSRIMLSLQTVLTYSGDIGTMVFDEIDTGVSGSTSRKIGLCLRMLGENRQILCVTHSAQVAAASNEQFKIKKEEKDGRTFTSIRALSGDERKREIARILGGLSVTEATLLSAEEMLDTEKINNELESVESNGAGQ
ncbi:MAG: DNA repair protein RecN [Ruminococcaceae bacterium]|nr:DNA repair protein RecN [Oscillospiraceae bacterium]